jgi:hypothetical protein
MGMNADFTGKSQALTQSGLTVAAQTLSLDPAELWPVVSVETSGCGFLSDRRPRILFERHIFYRLTGGRFQNDDISNPVQGGYGAGGSHQYDRLQAAIALDRSAALQSASFGIGQIMGENFAMAGFDSVESMVGAMADSEDAQLQSISAFIQKRNLAEALQKHDWAAFARSYNGPTYAINQYDTKLAAAYRGCCEGAMPDLGVRTAQLYLTFLGYNPGPIDGVAGARTKSAIMEFQRGQQVPETGAADSSVLQLLRAKLDLQV